MSLPQKKGYTVADIYNLPDGERAELIDGQIYDMTPPPMRVHQKIVIELSVIISNYIKENGGLYPAPFAVFLNRDDKTYVEPDISVICDKDKLSDRGCEGAPDWIIEVVSPSSKRMDYSETILSGQPKKRRLPPHIFQAFYLAQPKGLCGNYRHFPAKRF